MVALDSDRGCEDEAEIAGRSLEHWCALGEAVPDILLLVRKDGTILYANRAPESFVASEVVGSNVLDLALVEDREGLRASLGETFTTGRTSHRELIAIHPDGETHWYSTHTGPVREDSEIVAAVIVARDITDRKAGEEALRESEARYRILVEHAPEAIVILDADTARFVDANANACELYGLPYDELIGADPMRLSPPLQPNGEPSQLVAFRYINEALDGGTPVFDWVHLVRGDEEIQCQVRLVSLPYNGGRLVRGSVTDVTQQRRIEAQMNLTQRLESLGLLAGGIAHDFNNVLAVISTWASLLAGPDVEREDVAEAAEAIRVAADRGATLTRQLLTFARHQTSEPEPQNLHRVIDDVTALLQPLVGTDIHLDKRLTPGSVFVHAARGQLEQVLMNLLLNARDAMPDGGHVTVLTSIRTDGPERAVSLSVVDDGVGMDEATCRHVFEPLFTTKGPEAGTGLGLSTVRAIVSGLGGEVFVKSRVGVGSRFEVALPMV